MIQASAPSWNRSNSEPSKVDRVVNKETFLQRCSDDKASELYSLAPVTPRSVPADEVVCYPSAFLNTQVTVKIVNLYTPLNEWKEQ